MTIAGTVYDHKDELPTTRGIHVEVDVFLADSAEAVQGKIYALGAGWNLLWAHAFPVTQPRIAIGIIVRVPYTATNQMHNLSVSLQTEDGETVQLGLIEPPGGGDAQPLNELGGQFNVGRPPLLPAGDEQVLALALQIDGLTFRAPGMFSWVVQIDGTEVRRVPMRVAQLAPGQAI